MGHRRREPQPTFGAIATFWLHSDAPNFGSFLLDPEDVISLSLGATWNLVEEQGAHDLDIRLRGKKGLSQGSRYIGTKRTRTHLLFYSILFYSILFYSNLFESILLAETSNLILGICVVHDCVLHKGYS